MIMTSTYKKCLNDGKEYTYNEWFFLAENELRNATGNFDLDVEFIDEFDEVIETFEYVTAIGGMENYVIFKNKQTFYKNKGVFMNTDDGNINVTEPIKLSHGIAFKLYFNE